MTLFTCKVASVPGTAAHESQLADALRTFRYHYLCKFYLPMYRALRWDPATERHQQHYHQNPMDTVASWRLVDDKKGPTTVLASARSRASCSRLIEKSTFHRELMRAARPTGHEKRCWSLEEGDAAARWRQNRNNRKNSSAVFSKSDRNLPMMATSAADSAAGRHRPFGSANICDIHRHHHHHHQQQQLIRSHSLALASSSNPTAFCSLPSCRAVSGNHDACGSCRKSHDRLSSSQQKGTSDCDRDSFKTRQMALQQEAKLALALAQPMARMQLEVEKQIKKRQLTSSPPPSFAKTLEIVNRRNSGGSNQLAKRMDRMNLAEVQLVANDFLSQIEELNEELMRLLVERDELHMEQDSVLVDIDDLTRRAQETTMALKFDQMAQGGAAVSTAS